MSCALGAYGRGHRGCAARSSCPTRTTRATRAAWPAIALSFMRHQLGIAFVVWLDHQANEVALLTLGVFLDADPCGELHAIELDKASDLACP